MSPIAHDPSDLDLLGLRADGAESLATLRGVRFLLAGGVESFHVGGAVSPPLARALRSAKARSGAWQDPNAQPPALQPCQHILSAEGWSVEAGMTSLVYLVEPGVSHPVDVRIERSDGPVPRWMRDANPGNWHPTEWTELLDGRLGPWTMATLDHRIASICHTPVPMTDHYAECGVWTDPEHRRRGYASATTAQWAQVLRGTGRSLFYSTHFENISSQGVAQQLGLRLLGYELGLGEVRARDDHGVHPLSRARPGPA